MRAPGPVSPAQAKPGGGLGRASASIAIGTAISRLTGFIKILVIAAALGFGKLADSYNLANTTPNMVYELVAGGILAATVIPVFVDRLSLRQDKEGWHDVSAVVSLAFALLLVATGAFVLCAPEVIHLYSLSASREVATSDELVATRLLRLFAPQVLFYGAITIVTAILNSKRSFRAPAFAPAVNNLVVMGVLVAAIVVFPHRDLGTARNGAGLLLLLGIGTTAGVAAQLLVILPSLFRLRPRLRWTWDPLNPAVRSIVRLSGWTFGFVLTNQLCLFVVLTLAHGARGNGGVTAWTYAYAFFQLPYGVIAVSVMSVVEPDLARRWSQGDLRGFRRRLTAGLSATLAGVVPCAAGLAVLATPLVKVTLDRGSAIHTGTAGTGSLLFALAWGLPGFCAYLYLGRAWQAMKNTKALFWLYFAENGLNVVLALALVGPLGLSGLGWALSGAYTTAAMLSAAALWSQQAGLLGGRLPRLALRVAPPTAAMAVATLWLSHHDPIGGLPNVVVAGCGGVTVFFLVAVLATLASQGEARGEHRHSHRHWS